MKKVKVTEINDYNYTLFDGEKTYIKNIELYSDRRIQVNDIIYISEKILNENNLFAFTNLFHDRVIELDDIIKIVSNDKEYYLQRIYG